MLTKKLIRPVVMTALIAHGSLAQTTLCLWEFNEAAGTRLHQTANTGTLAGGWETNAAWAVNESYVKTDGTGLLTTTGPTEPWAINKSASGGAGLNITASSGVYEMIYSGVKFTDLSGEDYLLFGFRTTATGSLVSSSRERANLKVGDFDGTPGLDIEASINVGTVLASAYNVTADFSGTFTFVLRLDTNTNLATAFYDQGAGLVQVGDPYAIVTSATINTAAFRVVVPGNPTKLILPIDLSGSDIVITVPSEAASDYLLQASSDLGATDPWATIETQTGTGSQLSFTHPAPASGEGKFYRVEVKDTVVPSISIDSITVVLLP